ncbi:MAG: hypothetical protein SCM96_06935 [Acidobacteriota bacterium]|nr:hypothetical protein [Acidobacteriota bacterium]
MFDPLHSRGKFTPFAFFFVCLFAGLLIGSPESTPARKESRPTDPAQRHVWFKQHMAMKNASIFKEMTWRNIGPDIISGRCTDIDVPKGQIHTIYVGSSHGGVWKTVNSGITWEPIMEDLPTGSIGDIAVDPSNPDIVWVGTGEANIFRSSTAGIGIYKSVDAGKSWRHMGLDDTYTIGRIVVHPGDSNTVYVAASGHEWTDNEERGVFKTRDGGETWEKVLFISERIGAWDLAIDPLNPDTLYASTWNRIRRPWTDPVPGPGDGLFKTTDGGKTWKHLTNGLPDMKLTGRIGIDIARSNPNVLYAYIDNHNPGRLPKEGERDAYGRLRTGRVLVGPEVYRSDDKGESWRKVSPDLEGAGATYGWVFGQIRVDPNDEDTIYIMALRMSRSTDGGKTFSSFSYPGLHGDHHGLWICPEDSNYLINANDGGINISYDGGATWRDFHHNMNLGTFYNVSYDMKKPFNVYGSVQDHPTFRVNISHGLPRKRGEPGLNTRWETAPGGEETHIAVDPENPHIIYSAGKTQNNRLSRSEFTPGLDGMWVSHRVNPVQVEGEPLLRTKWLVPVILSPHNHKVVYYGMQYLFRSMDMGETWDRISPDLSHQDPARMGEGQYAIPHQCITQISESPFQFGLIYAGTDDGKMHVTLNGGCAWTDITRGLPDYKTVSRIVASQYDKGTVYVTLNGRMTDDFTDYIFKSVDYGKTWVDISGNIPGGPVNVIREDPKNQDILYAGTDLGVYATLDGGKTWYVLGGNLPTCYVWDLIIHPRDNVMVIATHGRGMYVIDDMTPVNGK